VKSKMWLISLGLAVVLVVGTLVPGCAGGPKQEWLYSPYTEKKISLTLTTDTGPIEVAVATKIVEQLNDFGIDVKLETMDPTAYTSAMFDDPVTGGLQLFLGSDHPSPDPYSRWIWWYGLDYYEGYWNPCYWYNATFEELFPLLFFEGEDLQQVTLDIQEVFHGDIPMYMMYRRDMINAYRTDRWTNWYEGMGGQVVWCNPYSIWDVKWVGGGGTKSLRLAWDHETALNMDISPLTLTEQGCQYLLQNYDTYAHFARLGFTDSGYEEDPWEFKPGLITHYEVFDDTRSCPIREHDVDVQVWRLHVREGVKWHDYDVSGKNVTAYDIEWTVENHSSPWEYDKPSNWKLYFEGDEEAGIEPYQIDPSWWVEVVDDYTIDFIYDQPITTDTFPSWWTWEPIVPKHKFEDCEDPKQCTGDYVGSGPFKLVEYEQGDHYKYVRNPDWWGWDENGGPYEGEVEELWFYVIPEISNWQMALENGDVDWMQWPSPSVIEYLDSLPNIDISITPGIGIHYLGFNLAIPEKLWCKCGVDCQCDDEEAVWKGYRYYDQKGSERYGWGGPFPDPAKNPLHDKVLREAIAYAIDVEDIIDLVYQGHAELADSWVYTDSPNHHPDLELYEYNPTKARQMLEAAGYWWE